jgi:putative flippase GtrA
MSSLRKLSSATFLHYGMGSAIALGSDVGLFMALLDLGIPPVAASALGYSLGILVHWLISSRLVFASTAAPAGPARTRQKALFVASALAGLGITTAIMAAAAMAGTLPIIAKLVAIVVSFQATYMLRKSYVFVA